jgi:RNA-directed DNA polymerase
VTDRPEGKRSAIVPEVATQAEETRSRWSWTEPSVWTERMLTALENGVKGGVWYSLIDKVYAKANLEAAFRRVETNRGSPGVDHVTIRQFAKRSESEIMKLHESLKDGSYRPQAIRRVYMPKPGSVDKRPLGIPTVRDRTVQAALRNVIEPIFEREFAQHSYGFRPGRGCKDALREVDRLLKQGYVHVVDADLRSYFDTIPHDQLVERVKERVADGQVLELIESFLKQGVMDGHETWTSEEGTPQGAVVSPMLANVYLNPLDHNMAHRGYAMIRYADDLVILCRTQQEAEEALQELRSWTEQAGLKLHPDKTRIVDMGQVGAGVEFLGYHFLRTRRGRLARMPRKKSLTKFKDAIRQRTRHCNGESLPCIICDVNAVTRGWFEYFKHSYRGTFRPLDGWIRMRLRRILRRRSGRHRRERRVDHQRWTNAFLAAHGLFSMTEAYAALCQSARR